MTRRQLFARALGVVGAAALVFVFVGSVRFTCWLFPDLFADS